jgi:hypothetical protein
MVFSSKYYSFSKDIGAVLLMLAVMLLQFTSQKNDVTVIVASRGSGTM